MREKSREKPGRARFLRLGPITFLFEKQVTPGSFLVAFEYTCSIPKPETRRREVHMVGAAGRGGWQATEGGRGVGMPSPTPSDVIQISMANLSGYRVVHGSVLNSRGYRITITFQSWAFASKGLFHRRGCDYREDKGRVVPLGRRVMGLIPHPSGRGHASRTRSNGKPTYGSAILCNSTRLLF